MRKQFNYNKRAIIATNLETGEVREFESMKASLELVGFKCSTSLTLLIRRKKGIRNGWKFTYKD